MYFASFAINEKLQVTLEVTERGLRCVLFAGHRKFRKDSLDLIDSEQQCRPYFEEIRQYFERKRKMFSIPVDITGHSEFQRSVWQVTRKIPYGETRSYGWVAERLDHPNAARAVGQALHANPIPIVIPCHRVIRADGELGGFGLGAEFKKTLLNLEKD